MGNQQGLNGPAPAPPRGAGAPVQLTMYWRLNECVTACRVSDRFLFLDVAEDRYLSLPAAVTEDFLSWLDAPGALPPHSCKRILSELRFDHRAACAAGFPMRCPITMASAIDSRTLARVHTRAGDLMSVGHSVVSAARDVRSRPLDRVLARRFSRRSKQDGVAADLEAKLARFRWHRTLVPVPRVCLHDCLALIDWLGSSSAGISLVFGVAAYPFTAHCWLQAGSEVLDDHPESPSRFQPILHFP